MAFGVGWGAGLIAQAVGGDEAMVLFGVVIQVVVLVFKVLFIMFYEWKQKASSSLSECIAGMVSVVEDS